MLLKLEFQCFRFRKNASHVSLILGPMLVRSHCSYLAFVIKTVLVALIGHTECLSDWKTGNF